VRTRLLTVTAAGSGAMLALSGCALLHSSAHAAASAPATDVAAAVRTSGRPSSYSPLSGPVMAASALPRTCSAMLTQAQLQNVFGAGVGDGTKYASYAALPNIDRTGRVACIFGVGLDSFGRQSDGAVEIAIATYGSAADAVRRAADTAQQDAANGATAAQISVGGHPATLIVEPQTVSVPTTAAASPSAALTPASAPAIPSASAAASASATATASASGGETELVLADGNRTFVLQIPFGELSSTQAATVLTQLALFAYQNTLPAAGAAAKQSPSTG
jgi:hypothetical protein